MSDSEAERPDRVFVRALLLLLLAIAVVVVLPLTPFAGWLEAPAAAAQWVRGLGTGGAAVFFAAMVICVLAGVPRLLFCPVAGALFGFWSGLAFCVVGTLASYYLAFLFVRGTRGRGLRLPLPRRLAFLHGDPGVPGVIVARLLPLPGMLPTLALAASRVGHGSYLLGSAVGLVPEAVPFILLGTGTLQADPAHIARIAGAAVACVSVAWMLARYAARSVQGSAEGLED